MVSRNSYLKYPPTSLLVKTDVNELENILVTIIPKYSNDEGLVAISKTYRELLASLKCDWPEETMNEISTILNTFLKSSLPSLPVEIVARIHTYIGLISEQQHRHTSAIESFVKALWVINANEKETKTRSAFIAHAEYNLARAYGKSGNYSEAVTILKRALDRYTKANFKENQYAVNNAKKELVKLNQLYMAQNQNRRSYIKHEQTAQSLTVSRKMRT